MKGCRALTNDELEKVSLYFNGRSDTNGLRDYALFYLALYIGARISEVLSIKVSDVVQYGIVSDEVYLAKSVMKGKREGRRCPLNEKCKEVLTLYIKQKQMEKEMFLFPNVGGDGSICRMTAHRIFKKVYKGCKLTGKLACHTTRKTFAMKVSDLCDRNILDVQLAMGHKNVDSTVKYVNPNQDKVEKALKKLEF